MPIDQSYKRLRTIEFVKDYQKQDIEDNLKQYKEFLNTLYDLQKYIADSKVKFPHWKLAIDTFITKTILHCYTFSELFKGQIIDLKSLVGKQLKIIDIPSSYLIFRSQLEAFLMLDFIYFQPVSEEESIFRYNCWDYSGLVSISKFKVNNNGELQKEINKNNQEIERLWNVISESRYFHKLTKNQRKKLKNYGDSRLSNSWDNLMKLSYLRPTLFNNLYSLLSKHAHSEQFSINHLKSSHLGYNKNNKEAFLTLLLSKSLICLLISRLTNYIKTAEIKLNMISPVIQDDIEIYSSLIDSKSLNTSR